MNTDACRLCLRKVGNILVNALAVPEVLKSIKCFLGFEILVTDKCSTMVCRDCIATITETLSYRKRVQYNQQCIQEQVTIQAQVDNARIKLEIDYDDDDVKILDDCENQVSQRQVSSSQPSTSSSHVPITARKSTSQLPNKTTATAARLKPNRMHTRTKPFKIVCRRLKEKDVAQVYLDARTKKILKLKGKPKEKVNAAITETKLVDPTEMRVEYQPKRGGALQKAIISTQCGTKSILIRKLTDARPETMMTGNNMSSFLQSSPTNAAASSSSTILKQNVSSSAVKSVATEVQKTNLTRPKSTNINITPVGQNNLPLKVRIISKISNSCQGIPKVQVNTNESPEKESSVVLSKNNQTTNLASGILTIPTNFLAANNETSSPQQTTQSTPPLNLNPFITKNNFPFRIKSAHSLSSDAADNKEQIKFEATVPATSIDRKFKVLSVNELNNRALSATEKQNASASEAKLPIRISVTRLKNEMAVKLFDVQENHLHFEDLNDFEKEAVKARLLSLESVRNIHAAIKICHPDQYTVELFKILGLSVNFFKNAKV